jgi:predicted heme/steroid binding protein/uncharacterized membrane protein
MQEFELAELEKFDGNEGRPVYVAYKGKVYDVSDSKLWRNGLHMKRHHAGQDMTTDIQGAPHEPDVLEKYPQVGTLKEEAADVAELEIPRPLAWVLEKVPMLRRHPHPMTVHFPIVFSFSTTIFNLLYLITGIKSLEITALHSLGAGILFTVVAIVTGAYTWWLNYMAKPLRAVNIKLTFALILLAVQIITFTWRLKVPHVMESLQGANLIYLLLILSLFPIVVVIGWFGAFLTFPVEKD